MTAKRKSYVDGEKTHEKRRRSQKKWYYSNYERAKQINRRQRAWERFEVKRYREVKKMLRLTNSEDLFVQQLQAFVKKDAEVFQRIYERKEGK